MTIQNLRLSPLSTGEQDSVLVIIEQLKADVGRVILALEKLRHVGELEWTIAHTNYLRESVNMLDHFDIVTTRNVSALNAYATLIGFICQASYKRMEEFKSLNSSDESSDFRWERRFTVVGR